MESPLSVHEKGNLTLRQLVLFVLPRIVVGQRPVNRSLSVPGGLDRILETMSGGILVIIQISLGAGAVRTRIQRVDEHTRDGSRPRYLDPWKLEIFRYFWCLPGAGVGLAGRQVGRHVPVLQGLLQDSGAFLPQFLNARTELVMKVEKILYKLRRKELRCPWNWFKLHSF